MPFKKPLPQWEAGGIEPPLSLRTNGWAVDDKPPAEYFNWLQSTAFIALQELQQYALHSEQKDAVNGLAPLDSQRKVPQNNLYDATTSVKGITKLNDTMTSGSTSEAATARALKSANDNANTRIPSSQKAAPGGVATLDGSSKVIRDQIPDATPTQNGGMSAADKTKLNGIEEKANNYTHPSTHPASIIVQDAARRMVSDTQINTWNAKETPGGAQAKADAVNSEQVNVIPSKNASVSGKEYPIGVSIFEFGTDNNNDGYPVSLGTTVTFKLNNSRVTQFIYGSGGSVTPMYVRNYRDDTAGWREFEAIETKAEAQAKANKAETNAKNASISKSGDTMSGPLNFDVTEPTPISIKRRGNSNNTNAKFEHDGAAGHIGIDKNGNWKIDTGTDPNLDSSATAKFIETTVGSQNKASNAETNAKSYADSVSSSKSAAAESNAKKYADGVSKTAETNAKNHATTVANTAESNAKNHADNVSASKANAAEKNAKDASIPRTGGNVSGDLIFNNDLKISHKSPTGEVRRTIHRGGDDNVYINTDDVGKTVIRGARVVNKDDKDFETIEGSQAKANAAETAAKNYADQKDASNLSSSKSYTDSHANNKSNPHSVTKAQVGLGSVDNVQQATKTEFNSHINNKSNPHGVTKAQVGLGSVDNVQQATKAEFNNHVNNKSNPHGVNSQQVNGTSEKNASVAGTDYPLGISYFSVTTGKTLGYPEQLGVVITTHESAYRIAQEFITADAGLEKRFYRNYRQDSGWTSFSEVETTAGSQSKATKAKDDAIATLNNVGLGVESDGVTTIGNLDALTKQGFYRFTGSSIGSPRNAGGIVQHMPSATTSSGAYAVQLAFLDASRTLFVRNMSAGSWSNWLQIAGNMEEGWQELTPHGGAQVYSTGSQPMVKRVGDIVFVRGALRNITSRGQGVLTLPGYCRPAKGHARMANISIGANFQARFARWNIASNGLITMDYVSDNSFDAEWWSVEFVFNMGE